MEEIDWLTVTDATFQSTLLSSRRYFPAGKIAAYSFRRGDFQVVWSGGKTQDESWYKQCSTEHFSSFDSKKGWIVEFYVVKISRSTFLELKLCNAQSGVPL